MRKQIRKNKVYKDLVPSKSAVFNSLILAAAATAQQTTTRQIDFFWLQNEYVVEYEYEYEIYRLEVVIVRAFRAKHNSS